MELHEIFEDSVHLNNLALLKPLSLEGLEELLVELAHEAEACAFVEEVEAFVVFLWASFRTLFAHFLRFLCLRWLNRFNWTVVLRRINASGPLRAHHLGVFSHDSIVLDPDFCATAFFLWGPKRFSLFSATYIVLEHVLVVPAREAALAHFYKWLAFKILLKRGGRLDPLKVEA